MEDSIKLSHTIPLKFVIFSLALGSFCIGTTEFVAMGLIQEIAHDLDISVPKAGHLISAYALGVMIGAPIIAILTAKIPYKVSLILLIGFYSFANMVTAIAEHADVILFSRFIAGLPHGAYFGIAALVVSELVEQNKRGTAIARMMLGLTIATVVGVPLATWLGQNYGWRVGFFLASALAFLTLLAISFWVPKLPVKTGASIKNELKGLKNIQMWMTLSVGAIGFGGMFSLYSYISPILTEHTKTPISTVPLILSIWGIGMVIGGLLSGWLADKALNKTTIGFLVSSTLMFIALCFMMDHIYTAILGIFFVGITVMGLPGLLQIRLMNIAGDAQALAASLNHSAFNLANALGAFFGGLVLSQNCGWLSPIWVAAVLSFGGLTLFLLCLKLQK